MNLQHPFQDIPPSPGPGLTSFQINPTNLLLLQRLPESLQDLVSQIVNKFKLNFDKHEDYLITDKLAGHIDQEYHIVEQHSIFIDYIKGLCMEHFLKDNNNRLFEEIYELTQFKEKQQKNQITPSDFEDLTPLLYDRLSLIDFWVNFQKKYEYNPSHFHTGLYSFVIWHEIPYTLEDEEKLGPGKFGDGQNRNLNGWFEFMLPNIEHASSSFKNLKLPVDKKWNGMIALFPSKLNHLVHPFYTSDEYRITLSGNIQLKLNK